MTNLLLFFGLAVLVLVVWAISIAAVYWDVSRRDLPWKRQITWIAVVALLPLLGGLIYLIGRGFSPVSLPGGQKRAALQKRQTLAMQVPRREVYLPTLSFENQAAARSGDTRPPFRAAPHPRPAAQVYSLTLVSGPAAGKEFHLHSFPAAIGRGLDAAVRLEEDPSVSRAHAELYRQGSGIHVRDLGSRHGTQVNGYWVSDQRLEPGDELRIGDSLLRFDARQAPQ